MRVPNDYDKAKAYDGQAMPQITVGGHICRIRNAMIQQARTSGKDMLVLTFDVCEQGEWNGYYQRRFERSVKYNPNASWPGVFRTGVANAEGNTSGFFKAVIEAVEASNTGYNFKATGFNETTLQGKLIGFNFGEEEYEPQNSPGEIRTIVKPQFAVSVAKVQEGVIPPAIKRLIANGNGGNGGGYGYQQQPASPPMPGMPASGEDDELPF